MAAAGVFKSSKHTPLQDWDPRMGYIISKSLCKTKMSRPLCKNKNSKMATAQHNAKCGFAVGFPVWVGKGEVPVGTLASSSSRWFVCASTEAWAWERERRELWTLHRDHVVPCSVTTGHCKLVSKVMGLRIMTSFTPGVRIGPLEGRESNRGDKKHLFSVFFLQQAFFLNRH